MKRCISFVAVSSTPQVDGGSLEEQDRVNRANAGRIDGTLVYELAVPGHSREYDTLAEIAEDVAAYATLRAIIADRSADVLLAYRPDRLARTPALLLDIAQKCWRAGIALYIDSMPPQSLDPRKQKEDMTQALLLAVAGAGAGNEMTVLRHRHRFGMHKRVEKKRQFPGLPPFGYLRDGKEIVQDPVAAPVVRLIVDALLRGTPSSGLVPLLNRRGAVTPSQRRQELYAHKRRVARVWTWDMINEILRRIDRYAGYVELNKDSEHRPYIRVRGDYEPLITDAELAQVQEVLARRRKGPYGAYVLSSVCTCAACGSTLHISHVDKGAKRYAYLACRQCWMYVPYADVLDAVIEAVQAVEFATDVAEQRRQDRHEEERRLREQIAVVANARSRTAAAVENLLDALEAGSMPHEQIAARLKQRQADAERLETEHNELLAHLQRIQNCPEPREQIARLRTLVSHGIRHGDPATVNHQLRMLLDRIEVTRESVRLVL